MRSVIIFSLYFLSQAWGGQINCPTRLIGEHPTIENLRKEIELFSPRKLPLLIQGPSGSGKEVVAQELHDKSGRPADRFFALNCAALPNELLESLLFGHEKGAFTGAWSRHDGYLQTLDGGTLFLDEVGDMALPAQAKLLRVLEGHPFSRVGGTELLRTSVRFVFASHKDLNTLIEKGQFRHDLYYRISGHTLRVPSLAERRSDIPLLTEYLLAQIAQDEGLSPKGLAYDALVYLQLVAWEGNIRELKNVLTVALIKSQNEPRISLATLHAIKPSPVTETTRNGDGDPRLPTLSELSNQYIVSLFEATGGNRKWMIRVLGINRRTLYNHFRKLKLLRKEEDLKDTAP